MTTPPEIISSTKWNVNSLRFTLFPQQTVSINKEWWIKILGENPDNINHNLKTDTWHYEGEFQAGLMNLDINPIRIDIIYIANKPNFAGQLGLMSLGLFEDVSITFESLLEKYLILDSCPDAQRIALGANLFIQTDSRESGYRQLDRYLPKVEIDPVNSSDFSYMINRRRKSSVIGGLLINRLSKWNAMLFRTMMTVPQGETPLQVRGDIGYTINLELDINTQVDNNIILTPQKQIQLLKELILFSKEIAENGDIP